MATNNQNLPIRSYSLQFAQLFQAVFGVKNVFLPTFGNLQVKDGIQENETAFYVKTSNIPVVVGSEYSTDGNTAFGSGTGSSSRFGERTEIVYGNTPVPYSFGWVIHEGLDRHTVNNDLNAAVADRLNLQAQAKTMLFNNKQGKYLVDNVPDGNDLGTISDVNTTFKEAHEAVVNKEIIVPVRAYVAPEIFDEIIDSGLVTTSKNSTVNIDQNTISDFRGFTVQEIPEKYLSGKQVIFVPDGIGTAFIGIQTARTIESEDFDGVALQGAGKAGQWISDDNLQAVFTAGVGTTTTTTAAVTTTTTTAG